MVQKINVKKNGSFWIPSKHNKIHPTKIKIKTVATFQRSLRVTLLIGQAFSLLPTHGIFSNNAKDVRFVRKSVKCLYSALSLFGQVFMTVMSINKAVRSETTLTGIIIWLVCCLGCEDATIIFYATACLTMILFFRMAKCWPELTQTIARTEELDPNFDKNLTKKCNITCAIVLILSLRIKFTVGNISESGGTGFYSPSIVEHILSLLSAFAGAEICYPNKNTYEGFVRHFYPWVFNSLPFSPVLGILTQFLHFQSTFIWNFSDLFVICISYYLTSRLEQVNNKLRAAQGKYLPEVFWRSAREEYGRATQVVRKVDNVISGIVFISFANNLFFICLQLFNTLEDGIKGTGECSSRAKKTTILGGYEAAIYFLFSLVFLITRSMAVSLIASQVNSASTGPAPVLYDVPSPVYCVEVQRFLDQVNGDKVALSGLQFFWVTKGLLLTVAGTIVTYELVMFQFNSPSALAVNTTSILPNMTTTATPP